MEDDALAALDSDGYVARLAIAYNRGPKNPSLAYPHAFVCEGGKTFWVKHYEHGAFGTGDLRPGAQDGLLSELVAGRLGSHLGAAAAGEIVDVPASVLLPDGSTNHLEGIGVGLEDQANMENLRYLGQQVPAGVLDSATLHEGSVARMVVFQTWIGAGDTQLMVDLRNGRVISVDHGSLAAFSSDQPQVVHAPGLPPDFARNDTVIGPEVERVEAVDDEELLGAVARVPTASEWGSERDRRLRLAESLGLRRDRLDEVMSQWTT